MAKIQLTFRLEQSLVDAIDLSAPLESRDRTNFVENAVSEYLRTKYPEIWAEAYPELAEQRKKYLIDHCGTSKESPTAPM